MWCPMNWSSSQHQFIFIIFIVDRLRSRFGVVIVVCPRLLATKTVKVKYSSFDDTKYKFNKPSWPSRRAICQQAVGASEDLRCPSVSTLCWMLPCRPPSMHMGSMWSKNNLLAANITQCPFINAIVQQAPVSINLRSLHLCRCLSTIHRHRHRSCRSPTSFGNDNGPKFIKISSLD